MKTVKLYKITTTKAYRMDEQGEGYSLQGWTGNNIDYEGYDDGGKDYVLPDGYEVAEANDGQEYIYNASGDYCPIINYNDRPALVLDDNKPLILKAVK